MVVPVFAQATIISVTSGDVLVGNRPSNLLVNGSFEADAGAPNPSYWATGTTLVPQISLTGWSAAGQPGTYASWGNDGNGRLRASELLPDGQNAVYFGGGIMASVTPLPTFNPDGTVTFSSSPVFVPKPTSAPVTLWQTVSGLNTSLSYTLDFWTSSEAAGGSNFPGGDGFFGLDITGESQMYFAAPSGMSGLGTSQRYYIEFQPSASTVTLQWTNWGHFNNVNGLTTELVLDDVILNPTPVPEPASLIALAGGAAALVRRRRLRSGR
jgi:hypothetical protein